MKYIWFVAVLRFEKPLEIVFRVIIIYLLTPLSLKRDGEFHRYKNFVKSIYLHIKLQNLSCYKILQF